MEDADEEPVVAEARRPSLDYIAPTDDADQRRALVKARIVGAALSCTAAILGVFLFIIASLNFGGRPSTLSWQQIAPPAALAVGVILVTLYQYYVRRRPGFLAGVLIGIGIAALIEGACFGMLR